MSVPNQIVQRLKALIVAANTAALGSVHIGRSEGDPFEPEELPAVNLLLVEDKRSDMTRFGAALGVGVLQQHMLTLVMEVYTRGGADADELGNLITAQCEAALAADPALGNTCRQAMLPYGTQWTRDTGPEQQLFKVTTLLTGEFHTYSNDPFTPV
jgi:hypothetical protein